MPKHVRISLIVDAIIGDDVDIAEYHNGECAFVKNGIKYNTDLSLYRTNGDGFVDVPFREKEFGGDIAEFVSSIVEQFVDEDVEVPVESDGPESL